MAGRGPQSFKKRQKEQQRKEWQEEKRAKRLQRKDGPSDGSGPPIESADGDDAPGADPNDTTLHAEV